MASGLRDKVPHPLQKPSAEQVCRRVRLVGEVGGMLGLTSPHPLNSKI